MKERQANSPRVSQTQAKASPISKDQPLDRALMVMDLVAKAASPVSTADISLECNLPIPTAHRLVAQLEERGLIKRALGSNKFVVGFRLVQLSASALEGALRTDVPHRILMALANEIGEHCQLGVRSDNDVLYVDTVQAKRSQGLHLEHGRHSPLYCTSIGKLYLAEMSDGDFDWWLSHTTLEQQAPRTIVSPSKLRTVVRNVRKTGMASSNEEIAPGVVGCAVPIRSPDGQLLAGLGISAPSARIAYEQLPTFRGVLDRAAIEIAHALSA
jgi:IclR family acetate operon transcriptional repressor